MMTYAQTPTYIDGVLKNWGDRLHFKAHQGRKGRPTVATRPVFHAVKPKPLRSTPRAHLKALVSRAPQVMVKITGGGRSIKGISRHFDYISRDGDLELEDETGNALTRKEALEKWTKDHSPLPERSRHREAYNIVLSLPHGSDKAVIRDAARAFCEDRFLVNKYVIAIHDEDGRPHAHICVKARGDDGRRLRPRKTDLQTWRECFAEKLLERGVLASATPRFARGRVIKGEKQAIWHIDKDFRDGKRKAPSRATQTRLADAQAELRGKPHKNPAQDKIERRLIQVRKDYREIAAALAKSNSQDDRQSAIKISDFSHEIPTKPITRHDLLVETLASISRQTPEKPIKILDTSKER